MSIALDDQQTQQIFLTLAESLEGGEALPTRLLVTYLQHPEAAIRRLAIEVIQPRERSRSRPSIAASDS